MIKVTHLLDDAGLGGVTRTVDLVARTLGSGIEHRVVKVDPGALTVPRIEGDIIVAHFTINWAKLPYLAAVRAAQRATPLVLVEHSYTAAYEALKVPSRLRFRAMLTTAYALPHRVVAVSHGQAAWLRDARLVHSSQLVCIPSTTDVSPLLDLAPPQATNRPLRIGAYGRYAEQKGFETLINAFRQIAPDEATLVVHGIGPDQARLQRFAAGLTHVEIAGPVTDLNAFLGTVDAVVVPSLWEAFGQVALEARAAARPVIASAIDGLVEQVPASAGRTVPPGDAAALAGAIRALRGCDLAVMGLAGRTVARAHQTETLARWRALFTDLAQPTAELPTHSSPTTQLSP